MFNSIISRNGSWWLASHFHHHMYGRPTQAQSEQEKLKQCFAHWLCEIMRYAWADMADKSNGTHG